MSTGSGAELALIVSDYVYRAIVCRYPSLVSPDAFRPARFQVKHTRARAWTYLPSTPPPLAAQPQALELAFPGPPHCPARVVPASGALGGRRGLPARCRAGEHSPREGRP